MRSCAVTRASSWGGRATGDLPGGGGGLLALQMGAVVRDRGLDEAPERRLVQPVLLEDVDRAPGVPVEARVEHVVGVGKVGPVAEGTLHLLLVRVGHANHSVAGPDGRPHPLPVLRHGRVGLQHDPSDRGEHRAPPVGDAGDVLVNPLRGLHAISWRGSIVARLSCGASFRKKNHDRYGRNRAAGYRVPRMGESRSGVRARRTHGPSRARPPGLSLVQDNVLIAEATPLMSVARLDGPSYHSSPCASSRSSRSSQSWHAPRPRRRPRLARWRRP